MYSQVLDVTTEFKANNGHKLDLSKWEIATFQFVNPSGTIDITGSNDAGAVEGVSDGNAHASLNYTAVQAINLATGAPTTSVAAAGLYKVSVWCKFIQVGGAGANADKVLVFVNKPIK